MSGFPMLYIWRLVESLSTRFGHSFGELCKEVQVPPELFDGSSPWFFPSDLQALRFMRLADDLGYYRTFELEDFRLASQAMAGLSSRRFAPMLWVLLAEMRNAPTLAEMLVVLIARVRLAGPTHRLWLETVQGRTRLCHDFYIREEGFTGPQSLFIWIYDEILLNFRLEPEDIAIHFAHRGIRDEQGFARLTNHEPQSGGDFGFFQFNRHPDSILNRNHNPSLSGLLAPAMDDLTRQLNGEAPIAARVGSVLEDHLARFKDSPDIDQTASWLGMSRATLQRRLAEEQTSFSDLRHASRLNRAKALLAQHEFSISLISEQLGFSSLSTFSRSFKALTGMNPLEFRASALALQGTRLTGLPGNP
jgi:AraC-like DNA-binding protein